MKISNFITEPNIDSICEWEMQQKLDFADLNSFSFPLFFHLRASTPEGCKNQTQLDENN